MITQEQKDRIQEENVKYETAHNFEGVYHAYRTAATHERELANQELKTIEKHNADLLERIKGDEKTIEGLKEVRKTLTELNQRLMNDIVTLNERLQDRDERIKELEKTNETLVQSISELGKIGTYWKALAEKNYQQLTFEDYLKLLGVDNTHAVAVTIWDTFEHHGLLILSLKTKSNKQ